MQNIKSSFDLNNLKEEVEKNLSGDYTIKDMVNDNDSLPQIPFESQIRFKSKIPYADRLKSPKSSSVQTTIGTISASLKKFDGK